jgi:hypothetical protein
MELMLIDDPTDLKRGFSEIEEQTFDCAKTQVENGYTATGRIN